MGQVPCSTLSRVTASGRLEAHRSRAVLAQALGSSNLTIFVPGRDMHPEQACDVREGR